VTGYAAGFEPAMRLALAEAIQARQEMTGTGQDDVPVGAVIQARFSRGRATAGKPTATPLRTPRSSRSGRRPGPSAAGG
jgi:hypothetical protein